MSNHQISLLSYWITERVEILRRRQAGATLPWSEDPIFQRHHFCNVHREDDRGTIDIAKVWRTPYREQANLPAIMGLARLFNWAPTLERIGDPYRDWRLELDTLQKSGIKVFCSSYTVATTGAAVSKVYYVHGVWRALLRANFYLTKDENYSISIDALYESILRVKGFGSFMAAQVVADVKHARWSHLALDPVREFEFVAPGPGSLRGATKVLERKVTDGSFKYDLQQIRNALVRLGNLHISAIDNQDLQNCLCEFDKYTRYANHERGRVRRYKGEAAC